MRIDRSKLTLLLVLVIGLGGIYWFVSREEQSVATPVARDEKPVRDAAPSHSGTSPGRQADQRNAWTRAVRSPAELMSHPLLH